MILFRKGVSMKRFSSLLIVTLSFVAFVAGGANSTFAQRENPTGREIARAAKVAKLNPSASETSEKDGKKVTVTPIDLSRINNPKDLEKGYVVAVINVKGILELPDGKYNVFVAKSNDAWQAFFESGGRIAKQDESVKVSSKELEVSARGTQPDVMAPIGPNIICFFCHSPYGGLYQVCIELPRWVNLNG